MRKVLFCFLASALMVSCFSKPPESVELKMPDQKPERTKPEDEFRTLTILIGRENKLKTYMGNLSKAIPKDLTDESLGSEIALQKKQLSEISKSDAKPDAELQVAIKLGKNGDYQTITRVLDELQKSGVERYFITDISPEESKLLE